MRSRNCFAKPARGRGSFTSLATMTKRPDDFGGSRIRRHRKSLTETVHVTADGRRLWVVHGDEFDGVMRHARWLAHLGDSRLIPSPYGLNRHYKTELRHHLGQPYWSLSQYLKHKVKNAVRLHLKF